MERAFYDRQWFWILFSLEENFWCYDNKKESAKVTFSYDITTFLYQFLRYSKSLTFSCEFLNWESVVSNQNSDKLHDAWIAMYIHSSLASSSKCILCLMLWRRLVNACKFFLKFSCVSLKENLWAACSIPFWRQRVEVIPEAHPAHALSQL